MNDSLTQVMANLQAKRTDVLAEARTHLTRAETATTPAAGTEARTAWKAKMDDVAAVDERLKDLRAYQAAERFGDEARAQLDHLGITQGQRPGTGPDSEVRDFLSGQTDAMDVDFRGLQRQVNPRTGQVELRDLSTGVTASGGAAVPTTFRSQLMEHLVASSAIRRTNATVLTTASGEKITIPATTGYGTAAKTAEGATIAQGDPQFAQRVLESYKYAKIVRVSSELLADSGIDMAAFLAREAGMAIGNAVGPAYINGTGVDEPQGIVGASALGITAASATTVALDEVFDLFHSVADPYRSNGFWLMNDATLNVLRKVKDADGNYILERNVQVGAPPSILGRPVVTDPNMPTIGINAKSIVFGDASRFYVRDVQGVRFERSDHVHFEEDMVSFRVVLRTDSELVDRTGAVRHLVHPAA